MNNEILEITYIDPVPEYIKEILQADLDFQKSCCGINEELLGKADD
jgi:hypothetical protein